MKTILILKFKVLNQFPFLSFNTMEFRNDLEIRTEKLELGVENVL
jgi:hypothetical protein